MCSHAHFKTRSAIYPGGRLAALKAASLKTTKLRVADVHFYNNIMAGPPKNKKGKQAASPPAIFAADYAADLGKVAKMQDAWLFLELKRR
jgi:hypothetical protein